MPSTSSRRGVTGVVAGVAVGLALPLAAMAGPADIAHDTWGADARAAAHSYGAEDHWAHEARAQTARDTAYMRPPNAYTVAKSQGGLAADTGYRRSPDATSVSPENVPSAPQTTTAASSDDGVDSTVLLAAGAGLLFASGLGAMTLVLRERRRQPFAT